MSQLAEQDENSINWTDVIGSFLEERDSRKPIYLFIQERISRAIENGTLESGLRLPPNRDLATALGVDRSTVARAYKELAKLGMIDSQVGRGTFICPRTSFALSSRTGDAVPDDDIWLQRFSQASNTVFEMFRLEYPRYGWRDDTISFAGGIPSEEFYPHEDFKRIVQEFAESGNSDDLFEYSPAKGHPRLQQSLSSLLEEQGLKTSPDEILVLSGSQQGLDLVSSVLLNPGDLVVTENPTYLWATCSFKGRQARCLPVSLDSEGMRIDILENILRTQSVKFIYTIPNFQNPTGISMSVERRHQLLSLSKAYKTPVLEDNFVGDLIYDGQPLPSLRGLDGSSDLIMHQGTISKALCPALRLGWLVAPEPLMDRLVLAKRASNLSTNSISQLILAEYLARGLYKEHLSTVRKIYKARRDALLDALSLEIGKLARDKSIADSISWSTPDGGMFVWVKLPETLSTRSLMNYAQMEGVEFAPGDICFLQGERSNFMRLCFIQLDIEQIKEGTKRLAVALRNYIDDSTGKHPQGAHAMSGGHSFI